MITAIGPGTADVVVSCGTLTKTCSIVCEFEVEEPEPEPEQEPEPTEPEQTAAPALNLEDFTLFYPGEKAALTVSNVPDGAKVSYVSSNAAVVTVDDRGNVTAVGDGTATITVTVGDVKLTCIARCQLNSSTESGAFGEYTGPFSLSHTDGCVLAAISAAAVGADIERIRKVPRHLAARWPAESEKAFFDGWVQREARGKRIGQGILPELRQPLAPTEGEFLALYHPFPGYAAAVSALEMPPEGVRICRQDDLPY